jgi:hypothetical protein
VALEESAVIVVRLLGGLGNQMFQYAIGRALAEKRGDELLLDASAYDEPQPGLTPRRYELGGLRIRAALCGAWLRWKFRRPPWVPWLRRYVYVAESSHHFDASLSQWRDLHLYLDGYWQSERYFDSVRTALLSELSPASPPDERNSELLEEIRASNAVAVHVRRTDYVQNEELRALHGVCSVDYYQRAMAYVCERLDAPRFYMFSDDPDWVRENLSAPAEARYVAHNGADRGAEDLRLMRECKSFVIANSSFSWWGAWLSSHKDKIVVAPRPWFADPNEDEGDLVPAGWVRM